MFKLVSFATVMFCLLQSVDSRQYSHKRYDEESKLEPDKKYLAALKDMSNEDSRLLLKLLYRLRSLSNEDKERRALHSDVWVEVGPGVSKSEIVKYSNNQLALDMKKLLALKSIMVEKAKALNAE